MIADFTSLDELRKDHERLNWLEKSGQLVFPRGMNIFQIAPSGNFKNGVVGTGIRDAIDAAMKQSAK